MHGLLGRKCVNGRVLVGLNAFARVRVRVSLGQHVIVTASTGVLL